MSSVVYTIGHSTRAIEEFVDLLTENNVELLVDVRRHAGSKRFPQFGGGPLKRSLAAVGIAYRHAPALGGRRKAGADSENTYWRSESFRAYADYMQTREFRAAVDEVLRASREQTPAMMCAEAVPWRCHRNLIADYLVAHGHDLRHIMAPGKAVAHVVNRNIQAQSDGTLRYVTDIELGRPTEE